MLATALVVFGACDLRPADTSSGSSPAPAVTAAQVGQVGQVGQVTAAPWLGRAERVVGVKVAGKSRIAAAGVGWLRLFDGDGRQLAEQLGAGGPQVLESIDVDGDGSHELVLARGWHAAAQESKVSISVFRGDLSGPIETIPLLDSEFGNVVSIRSDPERIGQLWIAQSLTQQQVAILVATRAGPGDWQVRTVRTERVITGVDRTDLDGDGKPDLVYSRGYGTQKLSPGWVAAVVGGKDHRLPSTRGARALRAVPGEGGDVVYLDGWHHDYRRQAQALITRGGLGRSEVLAELPGRCCLRQIRFGDVDGDRKLEVIAAGDGPAVVVPVAGGRAILLGNQDAKDAAAVDLDGDGQDEVVMVGPNPGIWRLGSSAGRAHAHTR